MTAIPILLEIILYSAHSSTKLATQQTIFQFKFKLIPEFLVQQSIYLLTDCRVQLPNILVYMRVNKHFDNFKNEASLYFIPIFRIY